MKKSIYSVLAIMISIMILFSVLPVSAAEIHAKVDWESKVSKELLEVMATKNDTDLILVYIWLNDIDHDIIDKAMIKEKGMDPAVYENEERFNKEIVPQIEAQIVARVGYEAAHAVIETSEYILDQNGAYHDNTMSLVERAIQAKENEYVLAKRSISKREHSSVTNEFIEKYINSDRNVIDVGKYVTRVIVEATKAEIEYYAGLSMVSDLALYVDYEDTNSLAIPLDQVEAGYNGTKGSAYNNSNGYKGTGIKIGVLEAESGQYDSSNPHLRNIHNKTLFFVNDAGSNADGSGITPTVSDHATVVTSIVVGQAVTVGSTTYEGVVPLATVYQTPVTGHSSVVKAFNNMIDRGVTVINYSGGRDTGTGYDEYDRDIDALIYETGITFVVSAGNDAGGYGSGTTNVRSPGKALNAITVGNADTINESSFSSKTSPFYICESSSYTEANYLPNKPDITAPGTRIRVVQSQIAINKFYYNNGEKSTGTSFAAPIVTGIVAQIQQAGSFQFRYKPALVKSILATSADPTVIRTSNAYGVDSSNTPAGTFLWEKSGVGMVNAANAVILARTTGNWHFSYFCLPNEEGNTSEKYFSEGQHLRIALTFEKMSNNIISSFMDYDDIDLKLVNSTGNVVASSNSSVDNVIIIDYTIPESGYYTFRMNLYRFVHNANENLNYYYSWNTY